jgi:hypothetical protein
MEAYVGMELLEECLERLSHPMENGCPEEVTRPEVDIV